MSTQQNETPTARVARYERGDFEVSSDALIQTRDELRTGDFDFELDPADIAEVERHRAGRPSLSGTVGSGRSPRRQVRLSVPLDEQLAQRAAAENRKPSEILRDALTMYLNEAPAAPDPSAPHRVA
ncbi:ribbon-helix-helix protein, CopG family [Leucobacter sp. NPDC058333]|uniref:ribbon-helix-helix protein, CopG family n=1 Tax=Leucobacter sp. NPDC058333 TaxID=3346450 RepID=UPI00365AB82A